MRTIYAYGRRLLKDSVLLIVVGIAFSIFLLQIRFLHLVSNPISDEGVYAEVGRMMMRGMIPHQDFPFWHMPLLPLLIGLGLEITDSMYAVRGMYTLMNCLAAIPLFLLLRKQTGSAGAGVLGVMFYLTFHEMMHHDFRLVAIRQLANILLIGYLWIGICIPKWKWATIAQSIVAGLSAMLFLPSALHIAIVAITLSASKNKDRLKDAERGLTTIVVMLGVLLLYFVLLPEAVDQAISAQVARDTFPIMGRLQLMFGGKFDSVLYTVSIIGFAIGIAILPTQRWLTIGMFGIFCSSAFLSSGYYPHYLSAAGPALAFGVALVGLAIEQLSRRYIGKWATHGAYIATILLFIAQFSATFPSLMQEWYGNVHPQYPSFIRALSFAPDPVLALEPIYAVEAKKILLVEPAEIYLRSPLPSRHFHHPDTLASKACTIVIDQKMRTAYPSAIIQAWESKFTLLYRGAWGSIFLTNNPDCVNLQQSQ